MGVPGGVWSPLSPWWASGGRLGASVAPIDRTDRIHGRPGGVPVALVALSPLVGVWSPLSPLPAGSGVWWRLVALVASGVWWHYMTGTHLVAPGLAESINPTAVGRSGWNIDNRSETETGGKPGPPID